MGDFTQKPTTLKWFVVTGIANAILCQCSPLYYHNARCSYTFISQCSVYYYQNTFGIWHRTSLLFNQCTLPVQIPSSSISVDENDNIRAPIRHSQNSPAFWFL